MRKLLMHNDPQNDVANCQGDDATGYGNEPVAIAKSAIQPVHNFFHQAVMMVRASNEPKAPFFTFYKNSGRLK